MYAHVTNNTIDQTTGAIPGAGVRLDTGQSVSGLNVADTATQQACGWYPVTVTVRPVDDATTTYDRSLTLVGGVPTVTWTARPKTTQEVANDTANTNRSAILTNLATDLTNMQTIIDTANPSLVDLATLRGIARSQKDIARTLRRLIRLASNQLDAAN